MGRLTLRWLLMALLIPLQTLAERRVALLVGSNAGWAADRPLRFAEDDARRMREVLVDIGGFAPADVTLLTDPTTAALDQAFTSIEATLPSTQEPTLFYFFYSGHADANALHLRGPQVTMQALTQRLARSPARLTVAVVDACMSGAILGTKGATPTIPFRLRAEEPVQGLALVSSSDADELSQESKSLAGSVFTHHWVSALRGAADGDGNAAITLSEAYSYAYERTRADTASTTLPQRPGFRFELKGEGDVTLTRLSATSATLEVEPEAAPNRYVVVDAAERQLVAEVASSPGQRQRLHVRPGSYKIKRPLTDGIAVADVTVAQSTTAQVNRLSYRTVPRGEGFVKGGSMIEVWAATSSLAQGDVQAALSAFDRLLAEDPHQTVARRGKARALLAISSERQAALDRTGELKALDDALALDPGLADDPSFDRFAERGRVLRETVAQERALDQAAQEELKRNPRLRRRWGIGSQLISTKGIIVLEGHWAPVWWLNVTVAIDLIGPGIDLSVRVVPLANQWSPFVGVGAHYGTGWWRGNSRTTITINGMVSPLSYDDIWGNLVHADLGMQWMTPVGFFFEFGGGPMLFYDRRFAAMSWAGCINLGLGWLF
jgi:hypothetical protein